MKATRWFVAVIAVSALALGACGDDDDDAGEKTADTETTETSEDEAAGEPLSVPLAAQGGSGVTGTVTFTPDGDQTTVLVELEGDTSTDAHPAHVHAGTCTTFDATPLYPLENVVNGRSETTIDATVDDLMTDPTIVNVHRSEAAVDKYIACGPIVDPDEERVVELAAQSNSGVTGTTTLSPQEDGSTLVVVELSGDESTDPHPAHIHAGTCAKFDAAPKFPLENVVDGRSETTIAAPISEVAAGPAIVNVHESEAAIQNYISCGAVA